MSMQKLLTDANQHATRTSDEEMEGMELEVAGRFGLKKFRMEKGSGKMERAYYDSEKGTIARNYMREQKLVCFDLKISGHENFQQ